MKVLIAEDNSAAREVLRIMLGKWGHETVTVSDGNEAWELLQSEDAPQLALLDWMMPGLEGTEICERVRKLDTVTPPYLILITAKEGKEDLLRGFEAGADDYIVKPVDPAELRARVRVGARVVELRAALARRVEELQDALSHIRTLQGLLPICLHCHRIRTDEESWQRLESYIEEHSEAAFSHSLCPDCLERYYRGDDLTDRKEAPPADGEGAGAQVNRPTVIPSEPRRTVS